METVNAREAKDKLNKALKQVTASRVQVMSAKQHLTDALHTVEFVDFQSTAPDLVSAMLRLLDTQTKMEEMLDELSNAHTEVQRYSTYL